MLYGQQFEHFYWLLPVYFLILLLNYLIFLLLVLDGRYPFSKKIDLLPKHSLKIDKFTHRLLISALVE